MRIETPLARVKSVNTSRILRSVWLNPGISRIEIARLVNLNKSTVTTIVRKLEEIGLIQIQSIGKSSPTGGRRPIQLEIHANWGYVLGIEIQTEAVTAVITNLQGEIVLSDTQPLDVREKGLIATFVDLVLHYKAIADSQSLRLIGIGVGLPGFVDPVTGTLVASLPLEIFTPICLAQEGKNAFPFNISIIVDNDANCGCWGELGMLKTDISEDFVFALGEFRKHTVAMEDTRILALGLGFVIDGKVHHGKDFSAGEYRSIHFSPDHVNQLSISDDEARSFLHDPTINAKVIDEISRHIAFLVHILNLKKVIIGGPIETLAEQFSQRLDERLAESWLYPNPLTCEIRASQRGSLSVAYGAANMFLQHLITIPTLARDADALAYGSDLLYALNEIQS